MTNSPHDSLIPICVTSEVGEGLGVVSAASRPPWHHLFTALPTAGSRQDFAYAKIRHPVVESCYICEVRLSV